MKQAVTLANDGLRMGQEARSHITFRVEEYLDRPVAEVRERLLAA